MGGVFLVSRGRERGAALLVVLWVIVVLGVLAGEAVVASRFDAATTFNELCRLRAHYAARAGVAQAIARLEGALLAGPGPAAPLGVPVADSGRPAGNPGRILELSGDLGETRYQVTVLDLNSRVNVNRTGERALETVLRQAAIPGQAAAEYTDLILDWIDRDDLRRPLGQEAAGYLRSGKRPPRNGPVTSIGELAMVRGMSPEVLYGEAGIARWLTTRGSGRINLNTAPAEVLAALPGFAPDIVQVVLDRRRRGPIRSLSEVAADPRIGSPLRLQDVSIQLLRRTTTASESPLVVARGWAPGCRVGAGIEALLGVVDGGPVVAEWRESIPPAGPGGEP